MTIENELDTAISNTVVAYNATWETVAVEEASDKSWRRNVATWVEQVNGAVEVLDSTHEHWEYDVTGSVNVKHKCGL